MTAPIPLSFLVPSYNASKYLEATIESIEDQLVDGDEVVVQDGGSNDGSVDALMARYGQHSWLKVVSERDAGQSDALQKALDRSINDYVVWLNADDIIYPGALDAVRAGLVGRPDLLAGRSTIFKNDGRIVRTYTPGAFTREAFIGLGSNMFTGSFAYRADLVREVGGFNAVYQYCMDMDLFARLAETEPSVVYIPEVIGGLRWHDDSKGANTTWPIIREATQIRLRHSRTLRERIVAVRSSGIYLVGILALPIRHAAWYSSLRRRLNRLKGQADAPTP